MIKYISLTAVKRFNIMLLILLALSYQTEAQKVKIDDDKLDIRYTSYPSDSLSATPTTHTLKLHIQIIRHPGLDAGLVLDFHQGFDVGSRFGQGFIQEARFFIAAELGKKLL